MESFPKCDFIPIDYHEVRHVKTSFKKLMRACVSSAPFTDPEKGFLKAVEDSEWLPQIQNILLISGAIVDLMDLQGSSVMMCLEDGWDFTTQVTRGGGGVWAGRGEGVALRWASGLLRMMMMIILNKYLEL